MSTTQNSKATEKRPLSRKSIAHLPSQDISLEKENLTDGVSVTELTSKPVKKSRSKSLGPGGLDALNEDAGNRQKAVVTPIVKSILKPTIPLSPPKQIPPHSNGRKSSPRKGKSGASPNKVTENSSVVGSFSSNTTLRQSGIERLSNPFQEANTGSTNQNESQAGQTRVVVRTEEEQQASAKERERQEILDRRDARRKSLANRRVSFAPEATLHTWDVVELAEDSTTSSASTNSTRRASALSAASASPYPQPHVQVPSSDPPEAPSTPPEQIEEVQSVVSPAHQRDLHQKKRRRSSGIPPMNFNNPDDYSSSPGSSLASDDTGNQTVTTGEGNIDSSDSDDNDLVEGESTVTGIDCEDDTGHSRISVRSNGGSSTGSSGRLEEALRQAAMQAGTQGIEYDENVDLTMEMADEEITAAFQPWVKKGKYMPAAMDHLGPLQDQENMNPFSPAFKANLNATCCREEDQEQTMELTQAAGAILPMVQDTNHSPGRGRRNPVAPTRRRSSAARRRSSGDGSILADETMELTTAIGGIQRNKEASGQGDDGTAASVDEEMTMEFTAVVGGVVDRSNVHQQSRRSSTSDDHLARLQLLQEEHRRKSDASIMSDEDMDMTMAVGGILPSITERTEPEEDHTMGMDITTAIGAILPKDLNTTDKSVAKALMEHETDAGQLASSPFHREPTQISAAIGVPPTHEILHQSATITSDTGSPSLAHAKTRSSSRRSIGPGLYSTQMPRSLQSTPTKKPSTPPKQRTPTPQRPTTPGKTPPSKNVTLRTGSPKKLFKAQIKQAALTPKPSLPMNYFSKDTTTGTSTPTIVLTPHNRRTSGIGVDRDGLGSPRVAALLDRRASIGDQAKTFMSHEHTSTGVRFVDPRAMEQELERERAEDERRESGRRILQVEADTQDQEEEQDATANLKDMIESLTPKKNKLKGRKSLHIGAAKGLLGKRPAELDQDEDDEEPSPKRLKGGDKSPVKNVRLPAPPSKTETTGRTAKARRFSLGKIDGNVQLSTPTTDGSSSKSGRITTPKDQGRFKDAELLSSASKPVTSFDEKLTSGLGEVDEAPEDDERIHLQDFLNMTSIRFMELTTTKRRHTVAPNSMHEASAKKEASKGNDGGMSKLEPQLESCVVAGACTVPMLELYQHSCRELKKYISEGRSIVREIEADTFEENPPLFREYMSAAPDIKAIMDNQFKNVKTHARLLSKAMWYEWRMKLLDGLREGLLRIGEGLNEDDEILAQQERLLQPVLPGLTAECERLKTECQQLQAQADELASCDQEELTDARDNLVSVENDVEAKRKLVTDLQQQLQEKEEGINRVAERKQDCLAEIKEAEKIREDCRGWSGSEVASLKSKVDALEHTYGWTIISAADSSLTLTYRRTLQLFFTPASFLENNSSPTPRIPENSPISLTYIADTHEYHPKPLTTEKRFFLQIMRARLQCLQQSRISVKDLLAFVSSGWEQACAVAGEARMLGLTYITDPTILSDEVLAVKSILLLRALKTKVEVGFQVLVGGADEESSGMGMGMGMRIDVKAGAKVVYGESLNENKMREFLAQRVGGERDVGSWAGALGGLEERLLVRGKKAA